MYNFNKVLKAGSIFSLSLLLGAVSFSAKADEIKIGTVDMQKALQATESGKKAKAQLESEFNKKKVELQKEEASLKKMHEEFQKQSLVMSDAARNKKQADLQDRFMKLQEMTARSQQEIQKKEQELTEPIISKLRGVISDLAKKKGYSVVLEKNENTVLFSQDKDDLTNEVVGIVNSGKS